MNVEVCAFATVVGSLGDSWGSDRLGDSTDCRCGSLLLKKLSIDEAHVIAGVDADWSCGSLVL